MKSHFNRPYFILVSLLAVLLLTACGQRGPLYLPGRPAPAIPSQPAGEPVPVTTSTPVLK